MKVFNFRVFTKKKKTFAYVFLFYALKINFIVIVLKLVLKDTLFPQIYLFKYKYCFN